jgi:hypothetical protein
MIFSLNLTKPLGRIGYLANLIFFGVVFSAFAWGAHYLMTVKLPEKGAHHEAEVAAQTAYATSLTKAKKAAAGKALSADETAKLKAEATEVGNKKGEEAHHHAAETWAPFQIFLLILVAIFFGGFASVATQRRMNDAGLHGTLWLTVGHVGTWGLAAFLAFLPYFVAAGTTQNWLTATSVAGVLILPLLLLGAGKHDAHDAHGH